MAEAHFESAIGKLDLPSPIVDKHPTMVTPYVAIYCLQSFLTVGLPSLLRIGLP